MRQPLRALAPVSLIAFAIALLVVVVLSVAGGDGGPDQPTGARTTKQEEQSRSQGEANRPSRARRIYVVKAGDNLAIIAEREGVALEELRALNPSLDPQGLVVGQRVKLPQPGG
jgi:LysM repeat protein